VILGIGADVVGVARLEAAIARHGPAFAERILSPQEMAEYAKQAQPARFLSKRFAAKEALGKATGQGLRSPVSLHNITVAHDELGKPAFVFAEQLADYLQRLGVGRHHLSISDEKEYAVAFVVLEAR
jgi:holo-[acyl-carrier protein] synthase